ncbi:O-antigen polymerase [Paenibacillus sp. GCM10023252]|uniref:O-antigen polymerase n=1 Tax=Paenibacillus sp. GCM10023252 TaxID=3252649 RepID=UPI003620D392
MKINIMDKLLRPYNILMLTVILSFIAWIYPNENIRRGFHIKESLTSEAIVILIIWYFLIYFFSRISYLLGRKMKKNSDIDVIPDINYYKVISLISFIGVSYVYLTILTTNPDFLMYVSDSSVNLIKQSLYDNYETGLHSLRYVSILGGAIALYRITTLRKISVLDIINLILLFMTSFISSRLSIILATLIFLGILIHRKHKISKKSIVTLGIVLFSLLTIMNFYRNANYYKDYYNLENPVLMNISEIVTYLGSPFQVSVGVANNIGRMDFNGNSDNVFSYLVPTYLHGIFNIQSTYANNYRNYVDIDEGLTTNSAFADMNSNVGGYSFIIILMIVSLFSYIAGTFYNYNSLIFIFNYVICYCFAELWRTFLFNTGIIHSLLLTLVLVVILNKIYVNNRIRKKKVMRGEVHAYN